MAGTRYCADPPPSRSPDRPDGSPPMMTTTATLPDRPPRPAITSFQEFRDYLRDDFAANNHALWEPGFQAAAAYRLGVWCNSIRPWILRAPVRVAANFLSFFARNFYGIELSNRTVIGRRLRIAHQHGIIVHPRAVIGDDCLLRQGVTIGSAGEPQAGRQQRQPVLGDRVQIGAGAIIAGPITVGDDVVIGPNAVVMTNVPAGSIVASPQARVLPRPPRKPASHA
jgi:serine O-acetyltransferase